MTGMKIGVSSFKREEKSLQVAAIQRLIAHILERRLAPGHGQEIQKDKPFAPLRLGDNM
jgi:hypothetical protein